MTLKANNFQYGLYRAHLRITNNEPDNPVFIVPVQLRVSTFLVDAAASAEEIYRGDSVQLSVTLQGITQNLQFIGKNSAGNVIGQTQNLKIAPENTNSYTLTAFSQNDSITSNVVNVLAHPLPEVELGDDVEICGHQAFEFSAFNPGATYLCSTGDIGSKITLITKALGWGKHHLWVRVKCLNGCYASDTLSIHVQEPPMVTLTGALTACGSDTLSFDVGNPGAQFLWSTGDTTRVVQVNSVLLGYGSHQLRVQVTNPNGCYAGESVQISLYEAPPQISLGADTIMCAGASKTMRANLQGYHYHGSTGSTAAQITADTSGQGLGFRKYWVELFNANGCVTRSQEMTIEFRDCTGIAESSQHSLQVLPNPANGGFKLVFGRNTREKVNIMVFNASGKLVYNQRGFPLDGRNAYPLDLTTQPPGTYNLVVEG